MGYTHSFTFRRAEKAKVTEAKYQRAIQDCQRIVRRYYKLNGGISGYTAHCPIGAYGGIEVNGKRPDDGETFSLREHFSQNLEDDFKAFVKTYRLSYDLVVVACLTVLKHRLGESVIVSSDGYAEDWADGVEFARQVTGLKLVNPMKPRNEFVYDVELGFINSKGIFKVRRSLTRS